MKSLRVGAEKINLTISYRAPHQTLAVFSTILLGLVFALISLGGLVRNEGAGLSCPDWPLCFGHVVPPMNYQVFLEWFHRLVAGSISVLVIGMAGYIFTHAEYRARVGKQMFLAVVLLAAQVVFGGLTVLGVLSPKWVVSHLLVGAAFFCTLVVVNLELRDFAEHRWVQASNPKLVLFSMFAVAVVFTQIFLGGVVSSTYSGLACLDYPTCNGQWLPDLVGSVGYQWRHRTGALLVALVVPLLAFVAGQLKDRLTTRARVMRVLSVVLLTLQISLGIGSVLMKLPILMSVAHLATGVALLAALVVLVYEFRRS